MIEFSSEAGEFVKENGAGLVIGNQAPGAMAAFSAGGDLILRRIATSPSDDAVLAKKASAPAARAALSVSGLMDKTMICGR